MSLYVEDFDGGTSGMQPDALGVYVRLLLHEWQHGPLPDTMPAIASITRAHPRTLAKVWPLVAMKFVAVELMDPHPFTGLKSGLINRRTESERAEAIRLRDLKRKGGRNRWELHDPAEAGAQAPAHAEAGAQAPAHAEAGAQAPAHATASHNTQSTDLSYERSKDPRAGARAPELPGITSQDGQESAVAVGGGAEAQAKRPRALAGDLAALRDVLEALAPDRVQLEDICKPAVAIRKLHLTQDKVPIPAVAILGAWIAAGGDEWCLKAGAVLTWSVLASHGDHLIAVAKAWDKQGRPAMGRCSPGQRRGDLLESTQHPETERQLAKIF